MAGERRNLKRKNFSYYMTVSDNITQQLMGYLSDISPRGFRLDCKNPLPAGKDYQLRMELTGEIANKDFMVLIARSKWCRPDIFDPSISNVGFEIVRISKEDSSIYQRLVEQYASG